MKQRIYRLRHAQALNDTRNSGIYRAIHKCPALSDPFLPVCVHGIVDLPPVVADVYRARTLRLDNALKYVRRLEGKVRLA